jgi:C-terminal processing protease CtpA/Prc
VRSDRRNGSGSGSGEFVLPGHITLTIPTGRFMKPDGTILLEGVGVVPQITIPTTVESLISGEDAVLNAAVDYIYNHQ